MTNLNTNIINTLALNASVLTSNTTYLGSGIANLSALLLTFSSTESLSASCYHFDSGPIYGSCVVLLSGCTKLQWLKCSLHPLDLRRGRCRRFPAPSPECILKSQPSSMAPPSIPAGLSLPRVAPNQHVPANQSVLMAVYISRSPWLGRRSIPHRQPRPAR